MALALDDPVAAEPIIRARLDSDLSPDERSAAHQALGVSLRVQTRLPEALAELRAAIKWATRANSPRLSDIRATYGVTLVLAGRPSSGLRQLDLAVEADASPLTLMRRGSALGWVGRDEDGMPDLLRALQGFRERGDHEWIASSLHNLGFAELSVGRLEDAEEHTSEAAHIFARRGDALRAAWARQNLGEIAYVRGDLPKALAIYERVAIDYAELGHHRPYLATVRSHAYLAAGLVAEAAGVAAEALTRDQPMLDRALVQLAGATALLDGHALVVAAEQAREARAIFRKVADPGGETRARLVAVRARARSGESGARLAKEAAEVAELLDAERTDDAPVALVVAARLADGPKRLGMLERAMTYRARGTSLVRASGWLARGIRDELLGDRAGVLRACGRGLDALDEHRRMLGSTELRALATGHGTELATLALRHAAHDPRTLLAWSERWRSTALAQPPVTPGDTPVLKSMAALRDTVRRISQARAEGEPTEDLEKERARLERRVRADHHALAGADDHADRLDVAELVARVGEGTLVELVDVDGDLHVLVVHGGRVRRKVAGTTAETLKLAESARFLMRRSARGRPYAPGDLGERLEQMLFGAAARLLPDGPIVVIPTARLHGVPWAVLPSLADRPFTVTPSAGQWVRASEATPSSGKVALLAGPGLGTGGAEVPVLAKRRPDAVHLAGEDATVEAALSALDGARLAHVAAHGRFRADSPLFSSLELADGPLTVHDLERMKAAPHRMVLSACESGVLAPVGADELLGLASALFALGTAGLVCSVAEVNDVATAALMVDLHGHLDRGLTPAEALLELRRTAEGDTAAATAAAFVALGA